MPDIVLIVFIIALIFAGFIFLAITLISITEKDSPKGMTKISGLISLASAALIYTLILWFNSGDCKYEGYEYINVERSGEIKFYTYKGNIYKLDKTFNDKEYKIKLHKWSNQWSCGIYHTFKNAELKEFVPIDQKETVESK